MVVLMITFHLSSDAKPLSLAAAFKGMRNKVALFFSNACIQCIGQRLIVKYFIQQIAQPLQGQLPEHAAAD
jgi:hypothetical protein